MSDTGTGLAGNDVTYETHVTDEHEQPCEQLPEPEKAKPEQAEQAEPEPERAPISWLRLAAAEIETKKGNPNPGRTRQSSNGLGPSPSARLHTMSESITGKLTQKDYTPEVDELLPQAKSLAQVRFPQLHTKVRVLTPRCFTLGWPAAGGTREAPRTREASKKRPFRLSSGSFGISNRLCRALI